ncbi:hypothetical protein GCM10010971_12220 [Silvimonas amylolytica]|uniref:YD repeat-containing protein n=1 Tax=Silvimonas amylolytica TaxID=449663 RepID=A0ABQ2PJ65_9NEIS|nr:hypothetical protein GCM10010971_12220 [Silvimonas amylolytica]
MRYGGATYPRGWSIYWPVYTNGNEVTGKPSLTDAASHVMQYTSYDANGDLQSMTDLTGKASIFTCDARNRFKTRQEDSDLSTCVYDPAGQLAAAQAMVTTNQQTGRATP